MSLRKQIVLCAVAVAALFGGRAAGADENESVTVLDVEKSLWRVRIVRESLDFAMDDGETFHGWISGADRKTWQELGKEARQIPEGKYEIRRDETFTRIPADTPADWHAPTYDASRWQRRNAQMLGTSTQRQRRLREHLEWKNILLRNWFEVEDPARAGNLQLDLKYHGGAVVHVNGREVARRHMPEGKIEAHTSALPYPDEAHFCKDGYVATRGDADWSKRVRTLDSLTIPATTLRKGSNLIAISIHRAPVPRKVMTGRTKNPRHGPDDFLWMQTGLLEGRLRAQANAGVHSDQGRPVEGKLHVWNQSITDHVTPSDYPDAAKPLRPVSLAGVRNSRFAGQFVLGSRQPIVNLQVEASGLSGAGTIPAEAVRVRYGRRHEHTLSGTFDILENDPPERAELLGNRGYALQPVWVSVAVPADAAAGDYAGTLQVKADGLEPRTVPLNLTVHDWTMPDRKELTGFIDMVQSPETVALAYDVELWSDKHFELLERNFELMSEMGAKSVYLTAIRRTHWGNEHAMVRWARDDEGFLQPNFDIAERYLDLAVKHLGKAPAVILYCWEPEMSKTASSRAGSVMDTADRDMMITGYDPETGEMYDLMGPGWRSDEAVRMSRALSSGIIALLEKRGMRDSLLFGLIGDARPTKETMDVIANGVENAQWVMHSHHHATRWQGHPLGMVASIWGIPYQPRDPSETGYALGWTSEGEVYYPRELGVGGRVAAYRVFLERWTTATRGHGSNPDLLIGSGARGLGRIGADFWPVLEDGRGNITRPLRGRYPEAHWGPLQLQLTSVLGQGRTGATPSVRSEAFREAVQELEARIFLDHALLDEEAEARLGEDLIARTRNLLENRVRMVLYGSGTFDGRVRGGSGERTNANETWLIGLDDRTRSEQVYSLAAEVRAKLGRDPVPNLD